MTPLIEATNKNLEKDIMDLAGLVRISQERDYDLMPKSKDDFGKYMEWFFKKTNKMPLYKNKEEGVVFASLLYKLSKDFSGAMTLFGGIKKDGIEEHVKESIKWTSINLSKVLAEKKYATFLAMINPFTDSAVPKNKEKEYRWEVSELNFKFQSKLPIMYAIYSALNQTKK